MKYKRKLQVQYPTSEAVLYWCHKPLGPMEILDERRWGFSRGEDQNSLVFYFKYEEDYAHAILVNI